MPAQALADDALRWPENFPPSSRGKRFFMGVRWLGPDLGFFRRLREQQAARTPDLVAQWGGDEQRRRAADIFGRALQRHLRWPTPIFLPCDEFRAIAAGPRFTAVDHFDLESAVKEAERQLHGPAPDGFWAKAHERTLGEVVDGYLLATTRHRPTPNQPPPRPDASDAQ